MFFWGGRGAGMVLLWSLCWGGSVDSPRAKESKKADRCNRGNALVASVRWLEGRHANQQLRRARHDSAAKSLKKSVSLLRLVRYFQATAAQRECLPHQCLRGSDMYRTATRKSAASYRNNQQSLWRSLCRCGCQCRCRGKCCWRGRC